MIKRQKDNKSRKLNKSRILLKQNVDKSRMLLKAVCYYK